jgi:hypothetical protein
VGERRTPTSSDLGWEAILGHRSSATRDDEPMPTLDAAAVDILVGVVGVVVALIAWRWPRTRARLRAHEQLRVTVRNHFPVFDHLDGSKTLGDLLVAVVVSNGTERPVKVTSWGVHLPGNRNLVLIAPTTTREPRLPHWIQPGAKQVGI